MKDFDRVIEAALDHTAVWRIDVESITGKARPGPRRKIDWRRDFDEEG